MLITLNLDHDDGVKSIKLIKGENVLLPVTPIKTGFILATEGTTKICVNKTLLNVVYSCKEDMI